MSQHKCDLITTLGGFRADATKAAPAANTTKHFAIIDNQFFDAAFKPLTIANSKPLLFNTAEAAGRAGDHAEDGTTKDNGATWGGRPGGAGTQWKDGRGDGGAKDEENHGEEGVAKRVGRTEREGAGSSRREHK